VYTGLEFFESTLQENGVLVLRFNRAPVNAISLEVKREIIETFDYISEDPNVKAVVLTGNGQLFSAGADLKERQEISPEGGEYRAQNRITREMFYAIEDCDTPVIAAIEGAAIGAGIGLACSSDIQLCSPDSYFLMPEVKVGLAGGASRLASLLPPAIAKYPYYGARPVEAPTLEKYGVVLEIVEKSLLVARAIEIAGEIVQMDPATVSQAKRTFALTEQMEPRKAYRYEQGVTLQYARTGRKLVSGKS